MKKFYFSIFLAALVSTTLLAQESSYESIIWSDGQRKYQVWVEKDSFLQFQKPVNGVESAQNNAQNGQSLRTTSSSYSTSENFETLRQLPGGVKLVKRKSLNGVQQRAMSQDSTSAKNTLTEPDMSELIRGDAKSTSSIMGLPGGIFIQFNEGVSEAQTQEVIDKHNLKVKKRFKFNLVLVDSPVGLATIEMLPELLKEETISQVNPNWWHESSLR